ncbi:MAG: YicC family protein [Bordetella sp.]|nr:MAG: YicC family protein [Bordetella sp.]
MANSMTAFGRSSINTEYGNFIAEIRSVNGRFLDLKICLPDEFLYMETLIREILSNELSRGKIELRVFLFMKKPRNLKIVNHSLLLNISSQLQVARKVIPDIKAPSLIEVLDIVSDSDKEHNKEQINNSEKSCIQVIKLALQQLKNIRSREGKNLIVLIYNNAIEIEKIITSIEDFFPIFLENYYEKLANKFRKKIETIFPEGFNYINGKELSERILQETSFQSLRLDIEEELGRLRSHLKELFHLVSSIENKNTKTSIGKHLDFLFQEMNREVNTLGSKSADSKITQSSIDLKLLIEKMREQSQNIE